MQTMHLFAGGGGGLLADLILGHNPIIAVEWDSYACQILRERAADGWFPDLSVWEGDVRLFDSSEYVGRVDCIHAGFPCQDISVAGKQAGLGEGTRSGLYREVLRIACIVKPRYLFLENVSAIVNLGLGTVLADLSAMGYDSKWLTLRASDVGAPHHRDRWWCLCTRRGDVSSHAEHWRTGRREQFTKGIEETSRYIQRNVAESDLRGCIHGESEIHPTEGRIDALSEPWASGTDVADTESRQSWQQAKRQGWKDSGGGSAEIPDTISLRQQGQGKHERCVNSETDCNREANRADNIRKGREGRGFAEPDLGMLADGLAIESHANQTLQSWWEEEPQVGRVTIGCQHRAAQLKALGNGQVPLQAAVAWKLLGGI